MEALKEKKKRKKRKYVGIHPNIKNKCGGKKSGCSYDVFIMPYCKN